MMNTQWVNPEIVELRLDEVVKQADLDVAYASTDMDDGTSDFC